MKNKLTPWFPGHIKPARPGVYQQMSGSGRGLGYQRWDGERWYAWTSSLEAAAVQKAPASSHFQNDAWRGLSKETQ